MNNPLLSVIIPVYNVEKYLAETLDSVIAQDIGFEKNIEIILVNDGSTDKSEEICKKYQQQYPKNITYIKQKNAGVSAARNKGIGLARGRYVNFLDADDKWSHDAFRKSVEFMEGHGEEVDFVASKIKFFGSLHGEHPNNYKFKKTRIINLDEEPNNPLFHNPTCIYKREILKNIRFDEQLKVSEDAKLLSEVLLNKKAYGVLSGPIYYYRKRGDESSAIGGARKDRSFYVDTPKFAYRPMMDMWRGTDGKVHKYMQYAIVSDLRWRIPQEAPEVLSASEKQEYKESIYGLLREVDDDVIALQRNMDPVVKAFMLRIKGADKKFFEPEGKVPRVCLDFITELRDGLFKIEGYLDTGIDEYLKFAEVRTRSGSRKLKETPRHQRSLFFMDDRVTGGCAFEVTVEVEKRDRLRFVLELSDGTTRFLRVRPKPFTGLSELSTSYHKTGHMIIRRLGKSIHVRQKNALRVLGYEAIYMIRLLFNWNIRLALHLSLEIIRERHKIRALPAKNKIMTLLKPVLALTEAVVRLPRALLLRSVYHATRPLIKKPVWIINDRSNSGHDNGEAFYAYLIENKFSDADYFFLISRNTPDFERIKGYGGKVLRQGSFRHHLMFLHADKIISAHADTEVTNPFWRLLNRYVDLFNFDFIFLQHGIIHNDLSSWLNRYDKNIKLFITSTKSEYDSILSHSYYYAKENILLSGLPRHDLLKNTPKNKLIIAPTNRKPLLPPTNSLGQRGYNPVFKESEYFNFYNNLLNDPKLMSELDKHGMTGEFYLHPAHAAQLSDFKSNEIIRVAEFPYDYARAISEGSIMLTDYSSVSFDFSFLRKPVVYAHFDEEVFFRGQIYHASDMFVLRRDGFGPVTTSYEETVKELVRLIKAGNILDKKYEERVEQYFMKPDGSNRKRVLDAIIELDNRKKS